VKGFSRIYLPRYAPAAEANLRPRYPIEKAAWIWAPGKKEGELAVLRFENRFRLERARKTILHVSGDMRYRLYLDGELISLGPDRCDVNHWSFASYEVKLGPGAHCLSAEVWWIGPHAPLVQKSWRGGFILAAEGDLGPVLNTGAGRWKVYDLDAWSFGAWPGEGKPPTVGACQTIDGRKLFAPTVKPETPVVVSGPMPVSEWSGVLPGWRLDPSELADQRGRVTRVGKVLAVIEGGLDLETPLAPAALKHPEIPDWQALLDKGQPVRLAGGRSVSVLVDLGDYYCGYSRATVSGGVGADVSLIWAEGLFERPASRRSKHKGHREEVVSKYYRGLRDTFILDGSTDRSYEACWWRSGRYVLITIRGGKSPVAVRDISFRETRYPFEREARFECDDPTIAAMIPLAERSLLMNAHETFMDCPHYEQACYVGDGRLEMLTTYALYADDRLCRRGLRLIDWSRHQEGFLNSSYPATPQIISSFPMYWPLLVHDYLYWRGDKEIVRELIPGMRANQGWLETLKGKDGLLHPLPGWPFVDTAPEWAAFIYGIDPAKGASSILNLLHVTATIKLAEIEEVFGEQELAARNRRLARELFDGVMERFWDPKRALFADDAGKTGYSEHAQCMALLSGLMPKALEKACFQALIDAPDLVRTQPCFGMFYLFETYRRFNRGDLLLSKMDFWKRIPESGLKTAPEMYEPSRSDCHGWGSHILFHLFATLLGIRPAAPAFAQVEIAPSPGALRKIHGVLPHPNGVIEADLNFEGGHCTGVVTLPKGVGGVFRFGKKSQPLTAGRNGIGLCGRGAVSISEGVRNR
jgi:hypothetical protein